MINLDYNKIIESLIVFFSGSAVMWIIGRLSKLSKDMNSAFTKIRHIEQQLKKGRHDG